MVALVRTFRVKGLNDPITPVGIVSFQYQEEDVLVRMFRPDGNWMPAFAYLAGPPREESYRGSGLDQTFFVTVQKEGSTRVGHVLEYTTSAGARTVDIELDDAIDDEWPVSESPLLPQGEDPAFPNTKIPRRQFHPVELSVTVGGLEPEGPVIIYSQDPKGYPDTRNYTVFKEGRFDHFLEPHESLVWVKAFKGGKGFVGNIVLPAGSSQVSLDFDLETGDMAADVVLFPPSQSPLQEFGGPIRRVAPGYKAPEVYTLEVQITKEGVPTPSAMKSMYVYGSQLDTAPTAIYQILNGFSEKQTFSEDILGDWFVQAMDEEPPRLGSLRWPTLTQQNTVLKFDLSESQQVRPDPGIGILSGSFPLSLLTDKDSAPTQAVVRVLYRTEEGHPGDGVLITSTTCNADGTWQVAGLNEDEKFDVVARIPGFNDVIISDVQPAGAPLSAHFADLKEEYEYSEEVEIQVVALGGRPPYIYQAVTLPDGLSINSDTGYITGTLVHSHELIFEFLVSDSEGTQIPLTGTSHTNSDPHWDKVVSLLHFDGELRDEAQMLWSQESNIYVPSKNGFGQAIDFPSTRLHTSVNDVTPWDTFTIECLVRPKQYSSGTLVQYPFVAKWDYSSSNRLEFIFGVQTDGKVFYAVNQWDDSHVLFSPESTLVLNEWSHVALSYDGNTARLFVNGVGVGEKVMPVPISRGRPIQIGYYKYISGEDSWFEGSIDEVRITHGISRYNENFTPPTAPFPNF